MKSQERYARNPVAAVSEPAAVMPATTTQALKSIFQAQANSELQPNMQFTEVGHL
jgi:hypothetical protein